MTVHAASRVRLTAGVRVDEDRKSYSSDSDMLVIACVRIVDNRPSCPTVPLFPLVENFADVPFGTPATSGSVRPILVDGVPTGAIVARTISAADGRLTNSTVTWRAGGEFDTGRARLSMLRLRPVTGPAASTRLSAMKRTSPSGSRRTRWVYGIGPPIRIYSSISKLSGGTIAISRSVRFAPILARRHATRTSPTILQARGSRGSRRISVRARGTAAAIVRRPIS